MSALDPELFNSLERPESSEGLESLEALQGDGDRAQVSAR